MRILALFDDGNGSVKKALPNHDVVSVGIGNADIAMALAIWALMAMMPSEAKTAAETPTVLDIQAREAEAKAAADYESPEYEPTQGDAEIRR